MRRFSAIFAVLALFGAVVVIGGSTRAQTVPGEVPGACDPEDGIDLDDPDCGTGTAVPGPTEAPEVCDPEDGADTGDPACGTVVPQEPAETPGACDPDDGIDTGDPDCSPTATATPGNGTATATPANGLATSTPTIGIPGGVPSIGTPPSGTSTAAPGVFANGPVGAAVNASPAAVPALNGTPPSGTANGPLIGPFGPSGSR